MGLSFVNRQSCAPKPNHSCLRQKELLPIAGSLQGGVYEEKNRKHVAQYSTCLVGSPTLLLQGKLSPLGPASPRPGFGKATASIWWLRGRGK